MNQPTVEFSYYSNNEKRIDCAQRTERYELHISLEAEALKAKIKALETLTMERMDLIFSFDYKEDDRFFANGYQSWSTTREYMKPDKMPAITKLAATETLYKFAGISSDCRFVKHPKNAGEFHSHCYTYIKKGRTVTGFRFTAAKTWRA